jgi:hypothetical protein
MKWFFDWAVLHAYRKGYIIAYTHVKHGRVWTYGTQFDASKQRIYFGGKNEQK